MSAVPQRVLLCLCTLLAAHLAHAQVYDGSLTLDTQAAVDTFAYTEVTGGLTISGDDITNLDGLRSLQLLKSLIVEDNDALEDFDGLSGLTGMPEGSGGAEPALVIAGNEVLTDLSGLSGWVLSPGALHVLDNPALEHLGGLESIGRPRDVFIERNASLLTLDGLDGVETMGRFVVADNPALLDLGELEHLTSVGLLAISNNPALQHLDGLSSVTGSATTGWMSTLRIENNDQLADLSGLAHITRTVVLEISGNDGLVTLTGLEGISNSRDVQLHANAALTDASALDGLQLTDLEAAMPALYVGDHPALAQLPRLQASTSADDALVSILNNDALTSLSGLDSLTTARTLYVQDNDALEHLAGLEQLTYVGSIVSIADNLSLINVDALSSLTEIGQGVTFPPTPFPGRLSIVGNPALTSLDGLSSLEKLAYLTVEDNATLSQCSCGLLPLLHAEDAPTSITIDGNAAGCTSLEEILSDTTCQTDAEDLADAFAVGLAPAFPNPFSGTATISYTVDEAAHVTLSVYDALGRRVQTLVDAPQAPGSYTVRWDGAALPSGTYVYQLQAGTAAMSQAVVLAK